MAYSAVCQPVRKERLRRALDQDRALVSIVGGGGSGEQHTEGFTFMSLKPL